MVSLLDVAKKAGVSIATASLALRGRGEVAAKTAERIRWAAEELGYKPNPLLASLATKRFRAPGSIEGTPLAILQFPRQAGEMGQDFEERYPAAILPHALSLGYSPTVYKLENSSAAPPLFRELYHRMVQGVIVVGSMDMQGFGSRMAWEHFSVVACARFADALPFHTVRPNIFQGIKLAFQQLRDRGYQRIGFAIGRHPWPMEDDEARQGAASALVNSGIPRKDRIPAFDGMIGDLRGFEAWVNKRRPDAVLAFSEAQYWHLRGMGVLVPRDMGFACLHLGAGGGKVLLSGLLQNREEIARQSVLQLDQLIRNRERGMPELPLNILIPSTWVDGKTLRKAPRGRR